MTVGCGATITGAGATNTGTGSPNPTETCTPPAWAGRGRARAARPQKPTIPNVRKSVLIRCMVEILLYICGLSDAVLLFRLSLGDSGSPSLSLQALCHGIGASPRRLSRPYT